jgi:hypothetical protein
MKALMIIASIIGFAGFAFLGFLWFGFCNVKGKKVDDPKLRIYGKTSFFLWFIVILSFSCLGALAYFASYFGRTENSNEVFALKGDWILENSVSFNQNETDTIYVYRQNNDSSDETTNPENVKIQVRHLSDNQFAKTKTLFDEQIKNLLSNLKRRPAELNAEAKAQRKVIYQQAKDNEKELRILLKEKKAELKTALEENKERRKSALDYVSVLLQESLEQNKTEKKIANKKWFANQNAGTYTALSGNHEYTVSSKSSDILKVIDISPYGFGSGYFDGTAYPGQKIGSLLSLDWNPSFKMSKAGKIYIIAFALGILVNLVMLVWLLCIIIHRIVILSWLIKWSLLPVKDKISYIDGLADAVIIEIDGDIEEAEYDLKEYINQYQSSPETLLKEHSEKYAENKNKAIRTIWDIITAGWASRNKTEKGHKHLVDIAKYYYSRYIVIEMKVKKESAQYHWLRKKAKLYVIQIKHFFKNLSVNIRDEFNQAEKLSLDKSIGCAIDRDTERLLKDISKIDRNFNNKIQTEFLRTFTSSTELLKFIGLTNSAVIGYVATGIALLFVYIGAYNNNSEIKNRIGRKIVDLRKQITKIEKKRTKAESFVGRVSNINKTLIEAFSRYTKMFNELDKIIFPEGDYSKSRTSREAAQNRGESYFSQEEMEKVRALGRFAKYMKQIIEADF